MSSLVGGTDLGNTRTRKIRFYPNPKQKTMLKQWLGVSRLAYNKTIEYLKQEGTTASWKAIKTDLINSLPDFAEAVPYQIKSIAIKDACDAVKKAKKDYLRTGQIQKVKFRSRKQPQQSFYLPKSAIKEHGFYVRLLGKDIRFREKMPDELMDARVVVQNGRWFVCIPTQITNRDPDNQGRVVSLDPGIRTFLTFYSETSCGHLGRGDFGRIQRLSHHLDDLISRTSKAKGAKKCRMRKAQQRMRNKISDLVDELHHKTARFLVANFDVILLPTFDTGEMAKRAKRKIRSKSVRSMMTFSHYQFKKFLVCKAFEHGKIVIETNEAYTSKTVSWTGEIVNNLGGAKVIRSKETGLQMDRDLNGARGILLRALVDTPSLNLVKCSIS
jgi:putative transposase